MRKRGGTVAGFESVLRAKDGSSIPVLISASVLFDEEGEEVGTVGFATDLRERKRAEEALQKAHDELEKRVEERTGELKAARERLQYLMTVTPGIIYTNQASGNYACTFVSENVDSDYGVFRRGRCLMIQNFWSARLHPEDAKRVFDEMFPLIEQGGGAVEYRFRHGAGITSGSRIPSRSSMTTRGVRRRSSGPGRISPTASRRSRPLESAWRS